ncbi:MAG: PDZ domain-containing protein [Myxococcales bacterium]|nr:PDZ domain-containing protein [Myxococcales bacterium]
MIALMWMACQPTPSEPDPPVASSPPPPLLDPGEASVAYEISFSEAEANRTTIRATARCGASGQLTWWMATWTPGSYLIREYARHIETLEAFGPDGARRARKVSKNRWQVPCSEGDNVGVRYQLYTAEMTVRTNYVDAEMGILNGAATFLFPEDASPEQGPLDLTFLPAEGWTDVHTALLPHPSGDPHRYLAPDVDTVIDAPVVLGRPEVRSFEVAGVPHHLVTLGQAGAWDHDRAAEDVQRITETIVAFWGEVPYPEYRYLNVLGETYGGLEHDDSTLMLTSRHALSLRSDPLRWLGHVSHEFFHTWNVKRLRPTGLGPFDYEAEIYTPLLWVAEGITSYYDDLLLVRAGLMTEDEYLGRLTSNIGQVQRRPGRLVQPLADASFDAWIKHYRRDENSVNSNVSYYTKGAVVAWLLDAEIRRATSDRRSLDDLMRRMWQRSQTEDAAGFDAATFRAEAAAVAGVPLDAFFAATIDRTDELDFGGALQWWGLRFAPPSVGEGPDPTPGWLGADTTSRDGRLTVTQVLRGGPAYEAGVNAGDEIIAFDDERLTERILDTRLKQLGEGTEGTLLVARRGLLRTLPITLGAPPERSWRVQPDPGASPIANRRRRQWLALP